MCQQTAGVRLPCLRDRHWPPDHLQSNLPSPPRSRQRPLLCASYLLLAACLLRRRAWQHVRKQSVRRLRLAALIRWRDRVQPTHEMLSSGGEVVCDGHEMLAGHAHQTRPLHIVAQVVVFHFGAGPLINRKRRSLVRPHEARSRHLPCDCLRVAARPRFHHPPSAVQLHVSTRQVRPSSHHARGQHLGLRRIELRLAEHACSRTGMSGTYQSSVGARG